MKKYSFKAKSKEGKVVTGVVEASNEKDAAKLIREKGLFVISLRSQREGLFSLFRKFKNRITSRDVATFTSQLATMINAGLPITEALLVLRNQSKGGMQKVISQVLADVEGGKSLSESLKKHPKVFDTTYVALVRSGEVGGVLEKVLVRLAENTEKGQEFKGKVKGALIYPIIIVIGMFIVGLIMMVFVIPKLLGLYAGFNAELPLPTRILIGISDFLVKFWPLIVGLVTFGFYSLSLYRKTPKGKRKIDELILKIPVFGPLQQQVMLTEMTRTLSLMVGSGVSILEGLNITASVVKNAVISDALKEAAKNVEKGFPIAYSFARNPDAFPYILSQMVSVGEETGKMDEVLEKLSHIFESESNEKVKGLTAAIEPIVMVILGLGVGFLVIAVILPIYSLTNQF